MSTTVVELVDFFASHYRQFVREACHGNTAGHNVMFIWCNFDLLLYSAIGH